MGLLTGFTLLCYVVSAPSLGSNVFFQTGFFIIPTLIFSPSLSSISSSHPQRFDCFNCLSQVIQNLIVAGLIPNLEGVSGSGKTALIEFACQSLPKDGWKRVPCLDDVELMEHNLDKMLGKVCSSAIDGAGNLYPWKLRSCLDKDSKHAKTAALRTIFFLDDHHGANASNIVSSECIRQVICEARFDVAVPEALRCFVFASTVDRTASFNANSRLSSWFTVVRLRTSKVLRRSPNSIFSHLSMVIHSSAPYLVYPLLMLRSHPPPPWPWYFVGMFFKR